MMFHTFGLQTKATEDLRFAGDFEIGLAYAKGDLVYCPASKELYCCNRTVKRAVDLTSNFDKVPRVVSIVAGSPREFERLQEQIQSPLQTLKAAFTRKGA